MEGSTVNADGGKEGVNDGFTVGTIEGMSVG